jgi:hypothetical protein
MALGDWLISIEETETAADYFSKLSKEVYREAKQEATVDNREMVKIATIAASSLSYPDRLESILEKLNSTRFYVPHSVKTRIAQNYVHQMAINYIEGQRSFPEKTLEGAESVCKVLGSYLFLLDTKKCKKS